MNLNKYEQALLLKNTAYTRAIAESMSLVLNKEEMDNNVIYGTGVSVVGPVFFLFVKWVMEKAVENGFERLYFFARDGQLLVEIAKIISKKFKYNIQCRYIYGSRHALLFPALKKIGDSELDWLLRSTLKDYNINEIFSRLNLKPDIIYEELQSHGLPERIWNKTFNWNLEKKFSECLKNSKTLEKIRPYIEKSRENVIGYFKQEGLFNNGNFAVVDIGWSGSMMQAIYKILKSDGWNYSRGLTGFYFSLQLKELSSNILIPYIDVTHASNRMKRLMNRVVLEVFSQADHGMTVAYQKKPEQSGKYYPILSNIGVQSALEWGVKLQQQGALEFVRCLTELYPDKNYFKGDGIDIVKKLLIEFIEKPTLEESVVYGKCLFAEEQTEKDLAEIAPVISKKDFFLWLFGFKKMKKNFFYWLPASLKRSGIKPVICFVFIIPLRNTIIRYCTHIFLTMKVFFVKLIKRVFPGLVERLKTKGY